jgi:hypothetical protein
MVIRPILVTFVEQIEFENLFPEKNAVLRRNSTRSVFLVIHNQCLYIVSKKTLINCVPVKQQKNSFSTTKSTTQEKSV